MASPSGMPIEPSAATVDAFEIPGQPPAATINVEVGWCGTNYPMDVEPNGNIGKLKRQMCELAGLPAKRQKHWYPEEMELQDNYLISSLPVPRKTDLISLNKKVDVHIYRKHFNATKPKCTLTITKDRLEDFDGSKTKLFQGKYKVGSMAIGCLIKRYKLIDKANLIRSIQLMRTWKHPNLLVMENLYKQESNQLPCLVLSNTINGTLKKHIKSTIKKEQDVISNIDHSFTIFFTQIIDLCSILDQMVKRKLCPENLSIDNLYLKRMGNELQLKILFDNVCCLDGFRDKQLLTSLCDDIKKICTPVGSVDKGPQAFLDFLGNEAVNFVGKNLTETARSYPINWTYEQKSKYIISLIPSSTALRRAINNCGISWPKGKDGDDMCEELEELKKAIDEENVRIKSHNDKIEKELIRPLEQKKIEIEK